MCVCRSNETEASSHEACAWRPLSHKSEESKNSEGAMFGPPSVSSSKNVSKASCGLVPQAKGNT